MSKSALLLGESAIGTGALKVASLYNVSGWVAVVTGGGTGLGLITAAALAENGAKVYITGRRADVLEAAAKRATPKEGPGKVVAVAGDASTKEGIQTMVAAVQKEEKYINLLVNNHGVSLPHADTEIPDQSPEALSKEMFENESFDHWLDAYRINTASYYFTSFAFLPLLCAAQSVGGHSEPGNIVNISSMSGMTVTSQRGQFSYNASKAATISLSHQLACEFARRDLCVRVNTIAPGYFPSGMTPIDPANARDSFRGKAWGIPLARPGSAVDYAQCIIGLAVNGYTTGAEILMDGGWMLEQQF